MLEVPIDCSEPASREWSFVCDGTGCAVAMAAWEVVGQEPESDQMLLRALVARQGSAVRRAARVAVELAARKAPEVAVRAAPHLKGEPPPEGDEHRRLAAMANRVIGYLVRPDRSSA